MVKLKTTQKETGEVFVSKDVYERDFIEHWIEHSISELGGSFLQYEILEEN